MLRHGPPGQGPGPNRKVIPSFHFSPPSLELLKTAELPVIVLAGNVDRS